MFYCRENVYQKLKTVTYPNAKTRQFVSTNKIYVLIFWPKYVYMMPFVIYLVGFHNCVNFLEL